MPGPVVITGAAGQLAWAMVRAFEGTGPVVALGRPDLDITDDGAVDRVLEPLGPSVIINCAAYNDVDAAEAQPVRALEVNAFAVRALSRAATAAGALFVHFSTDFVFDGTATSPYAETDAPNPQSVYAASKLLGEWFALESPGAYVLRVESLFGAGGAHSRRSSLDRIVSGLEQDAEVTVFTDRTVSPSHVGDVSAATRALVERRPAPGVYHCVNSGMGTWEDVAREAARQMGREPRLRRTTMADVKLVAPRPVYCALSNAKLAAAGITMPPWQDALARHLVSRRV